MPDPKNFDLDFRPESYWSILDDHSEVAPKVKGELRRQVAKELDESGIYDPIISAESLSEKQLIAAGRVHPMFMGGEYLPDQLPHEVEIARVTLKSTMMDVISIRARRTKNRIIYRIIDEYSDEGLFDYHLIQKSSTNPLTMRRIIEVIDNAQEYGGLVGNARHWDYETSRDARGCYDFATISSEFYPQLSRWYDQVNEEWLDARLYEETGMTKEERLEEEFRDRYLNHQPAIKPQEEEWRRRNEEELQVEREKRDLRQLHYEYEKRYKAQKPPLSENEIAWRAENESRLKAELEFENLVVSCMKAAKSDAVGGGVMGAWLKGGAVRRYIEDYLRSYGELPSGEHMVTSSIGSIRVKFQ